MTEKVKLAAAAKMLGVRVEVAAFALLMEENLRRHDADRGPKGWKQDSPESLRMRVYDEQQELYEAICEWRKLPVNPVNSEAVAKEAADVANFAMMIADVVGGLRK